jgi:hypothetical protein
LLARRQGLPTLLDALIRSGLAKAFVNGSPEWSFTTPGIFTFAKFIQHRQISSGKSRRQ